MRVGARIRAIANLVDDFDCVADVGTDHGILPKLLIDEKRANFVVATDISKSCVDKTEKFVLKCGLSDKIDVRLGDGLEPLGKNEVQLAVIAGMGGYEIIKILSKDNKGIKKFILQAPQNTIELRKWLIDNHFKIIKDFIVKDRNKFYNTLEVEKVREQISLSDLQIRYGLTNFDLKSQDFKLYLKDIILRDSEILKTNNSKKLENEVREAKEILLSLYKGE